jgi:serine/threonine-protein kinase
MIGSHREGDRVITLEPGLVVAGKFELVRPLARGGMGAVWVARHLQLGMPVAVKFIDVAAAAAPDARSRFEREARAAVRIQSPHVVGILDHGVDGETPYIAMELLEGEDLGRRLKRLGRLPPAVAAGLLDQIASGLQRAHEAGIVHRDLKPANIFLVLDDGEDLVKILDFGIAKWFRDGEGASVTRTGELVGSPDYMSPEQVRGSRDVGPQADLWSLGVIFFRAVTGKVPFKGETVGDLLVRICGDPIPLPSRIAPDLPPPIDAFFARALARDRAQRFRSAIEMAAAFRAALREAVGAPDASWGAVDPQLAGSLDPRASPWGDIRPAGEGTASAGQDPGAAFLPDPGAGQDPRFALKWSVAEEAPGERPPVSSPGPVGSVRAGLAAGAPVRVVAGPARKRSLPWDLVAACVVLLLLVGIAAWMQTSRTSGSLTGVQPAAAVQDQGPAPAVVAPPPVSEAERHERAIGERAEDAGVARMPELPPAPQSKPRGYLTVFCTPTCEIYVNGAYAGKSPIFRRSATVGKYRLTLYVPPSAKAKADTLVTVAEGLETTYVWPLQTKARMK